MCLTWFWIYLVSFYLIINWTDVDKICDGNNTIVKVDVGICLDEKVPVSLEPVIPRWISMKDKFDLFAGQYIEMRDPSISDAYISIERYSK